MLFHPVYTPEELKAVEVSGGLALPLKTTDGVSFYFRLWQVMFRDARTFQDKIAAGFVKFLRHAGYPPWLWPHADLNTFTSRWGFDFISRYKHKQIPPNSSMTLQQLREEGYTMDPTQWLAVSRNDPGRCPIS